MSRLSQCSNPICFLANVKQTAQDEGPCRMKGIFSPLLRGESMQQGHFPQKLETTTLFFDTIFP